MQLHQFGRLIAGVLAACLTVASESAMGQAAPAPHIQEALNRLGADLFSVDPHPAAAIEELKGILAVEPELAEAHMLLGIAYRAQNSPDLMGQAIAELRQALGLEPSLVLARLALARLYLDVSRAARAREELEVALEQLPGHPQLLSLLGEAERQLGDPARAAELNREALKVDPDFIQARYYLGLALLELRQHPHAIHELELVVKSGMNPAEANLGLGTAYMEAGRVNDALPPLREAARLNPSRPETHLQLSRAYRTRGALAEADSALSRAMMHAGSGGLNASDQNLAAELFMEEGFVRTAQGRLKAAAESFEKVLAIDGSHEPASQALAEIRKRLKSSARQKPGKPS